MLSRLSIRDVVLIDQLDLEFSPGLTILTGETGAGKSILLDALSLALGARGDGSLVRHGQPQGQVTATFELTEGHAAQAVLGHSVGSYLPWAMVWAIVIVLLCAPFSVARLRKG